LLDGWGNPTDGRQLINPSHGRELAAGSAAAVMHLGKVEQVAPSDTSDLGRWILSIVDAARAHAGDKRFERAPLTFNGYTAAIQKRDSILRALARESYIPDLTPELVRFVRQIYHAERHTPDFGGYVNYVGAVSEELGEAVLQVLQRSAGIQFHEAELSMHACVVGGSGSGKSELLKLMVHHYVKHPELGAVLVLDPHAKVAREIARWREFADQPERLVYLDAKADAGGDLVPALNPLVVGSADDEAKTEIATQLADAIGLVRDQDTMTGNMTTVARRCIRVLLDVPGATLSDLEALISADVDHPLVRVALNSRDDNHRTWFERKTGGFFDDSFKSAKLALLKRLDDALFSPRLRQVLTAPAPFDLDAAVQERKVICIDCASVGPNVSEMLGRIVMAQVAALGQRRLSDSSLPQAPLRVFVDEATKLMSPSVFTILKELRKVGISLIMAQQDLGEGVERNLVRSLRTNTNVKLFGRSGNMGDVFKMMSWGGDVPQLRKGQFIAAWGSEEKTLLNTYAASHLADDRNAMSEADWQRVLEHQLAEYYRPANAKRDAAPAPAMLPAAIDPMDEYPA